MRRPLWQYLLGLVLLTGLVLVFFLFPELCTKVSQGVSTFNSTMNHVLLWGLGVMLLFYGVVSLAVALAKRRLKHERIRRGHDNTRLTPPKDQEQGPPA